MICAACRDHNIRLPHSFKSIHQVEMIVFFHGSDRAEYDAGLPAGLTLNRNKFLFGVWMLKLVGNEFSEKGTDSIGG